MGNWSMPVGVIFAGIVDIQNVSETDRMHEVTTAALRRGGCALYATKESRENGMTLEEGTIHLQLGQPTLGPVLEFCNSEPL